MLRCLQNHCDKVIKSPICPQTFQSSTPVINYLFSLFLHHRFEIEAQMSNIAKQVYYFIVHQLHWASCQFNTHFLYNGNILLLGVCRKLRQQTHTYTYIFSTIQHYIVPYDTIIKGECFKIMKITLMPSILIKLS